MIQPQPRRQRRGFFYGRHESCETPGNYLSVAAMPHLKLVSLESSEPSAPRYLAPGLRKLPPATVVERFLLLKKQSRAVPRECMCLALRQGNRWTWQTVRINLTIDGGERDSEILSLSTDPLTATRKYEHAL